LFEGLGNETSGDGTPPWLGSVLAKVGPGGDAIVLVPDAGTYALSWRLSRHQGEDRVDRWTANEPATITVRDEAGEQLLTGGLRAEQIDGARARLEGR
jgi:hypothetical protein